MAGIWLTEAPWPPAIIILGVALLILFAWYRNQKRGLLIAAAVVGLLAIGPFVIDLSVKTDGEQIEENVQDLITAFQLKDQKRALDLISPQELILPNLVRLAMQRVEVKSDVVIRDMTVELLANKTRAKSKFRANGTFVYEGTDIGAQPSRWLLEWRKEEGKWKIIGATRLNPLRDEPIETFSAPTG